jgi:alanine-glyoxylate transaminase/serine-glyoxylate transaminase/serine-pyruvate transaminase
MSNMQHRSGRHFLQVPGPTPIPERILAAMNRQVIDHRSPQFQSLAHGVLTGIRTIFKTKSPVLIFPSSGTGAWEAALLNTLSPGDHILTVETGQFALLWSNMARDLGLVPHVIDTDWRIGPEPNRIEERLRQDKDRLIKAVCVVHNETSTGARAWIEEIRAAIDAARHPALLMVDTVSSLAVMDFRHDEWGVDVAISGSQKGMMLPPGLSFTAVSERAIAASRTAGFPRSYWQWQKMLTMNADGFFPYTPATGLLFGLAESISMLHAEGLENVFARHDRLSEAVRRAVEAWDLEVWCRHPKYYSSAVTAVAMPEGHDAEAFRKLVRERFDVSLAMGLNKLLGKVFRIGHLGDTNDVTIIGALAAIEMALEMARVPHTEGGVTAAMRFLRR